MRSKIRQMWLILCNDCVTEPKYFLFHLRVSLFSAQFLLWIAFFPCLCRKNYMHSKYVHNLLVPERLFRNNSSLSLLLLLFSCTIPFSRSRLYPNSYYIIINGFIFDLFALNLNENDDEDDDLNENGVQSSQRKQQQQQQQYQPTASKAGVEPCQSCECQSWNASKARVVPELCFTTLQFNQPLQSVPEDWIQRFVIYAIWVHPNARCNRFDAKTTTTTKHTLRNGEKKTRFAFAFVDFFWFCFIVYCDMKCSLFNGWRGGFGNVVKLFIHRKLTLYAYIVCSSLKA